MTTNQVIRALAAYLTTYLIFRVALYLVDPGWSLCLLVGLAIAGFLATGYYVRECTHSAQLPSTVRARIKKGLDRRAD